MLAIFKPRFESGDHKVTGCAHHPTASEGALGGSSQDGQPRASQILGCFWSCLVPGRPKKIPLEIFPPLWVQSVWRARTSGWLEGREPDEWGREWPEDKSWTWVGDRSQIIRGNCKEAHLAKRCGELLKDCKERSTRVHLNFNKITCSAVKTRLGKVRLAAGRLVRRPL